MTKPDEDKDRREMEDDRDRWRERALKAERERDELLAKGRILSAATLRCMPSIIAGDRLTEDRKGELHCARGDLSEAISRISGKGMVRLAGPGSSEAAS